MKELRGKILKGLSYQQEAEINAELDKLIAETDPAWIVTLSRYGIMAKIRFLELCRGNILNSIRDQDVSVPEKQPFRTIHTLIDQIVGEGEEGPVATDVRFSKSGNVVTAYVTFEDGSAGQFAINLDENDAPVSIVDGDETHEITMDYDGNGNVTEITVDGESCSVGWEGF